MAHALTASTAPILTVVDGQATTTSLDIARNFSKRHDDVLKAVRNLLPQLPAERLRNFAETFHEVPGPNNATIKQPAYRITRDGFTLLAMGFTGKNALQFKLAYIAEFNRMEDALRHPAPRCVISLAQQQHLKELVEIVHNTTGQSFGEVWSRLHHHFQVPRYAELHPDQFEAACAYLDQRFDGNQVMALVFKHIGSPRILISFDQEGRQTMSLVPPGAHIVCPDEIPKRITCGEFHPSVVKRIAQAAVTRLTNGTLALS